MAVFITSIVLLIISILFQAVLYGGAYHLLLMPMVLDSFSYQLPSIGFAFFVGASLIIDLLRSFTVKVDRELTIKELLTQFIAKIVICIFKLIVYIVIFMILF